MADTSHIGKPHNDMTQTKLDGLIFPNYTFSKQNAANIWKFLILQLVQLPAILHENVLMKKYFVVIGMYRLIGYGL